MKVKYSGKMLQNWPWKSSLYKCKSIVDEFIISQTMWRRVRPQEHRATSRLCSFQNGMSNSLRCKQLLLRSEISPVVWRQLCTLVKLSSFYQVLSVWLLWFPSTISLLSCTYPCLLHRPHSKPLYKYKTQIDFVLTVRRRSLSSLSLSHTHSHMYKDTEIHINTSTKTRADTYIYSMKIYVCYSNKHSRART